MSPQIEEFGLFQPLGLNSSISVDVRHLDMAASFPLLKLQEMVAFLLELCINQMATSAPDMVEKRLPESKEEDMQVPFIIIGILESCITANFSSGVVNG
ncbi:hypothetical protein Pyn_23256 [Prunus yedoensis var. nudiflora]|uniref:Uncharacterized protein n=1 Tax=Prunus yedoensis var. nudiflora TaxID=2094558 RepID=A0A314XML6_PRUYE|nr:hypothetical protein Pyn_23256 [Prunus yedoensis var. nudiflora]